MKLLKLAAYGAAGWWGYHRYQQAQDAGVPVKEAFLHPLTPIGELAPAPATGAAAARTAKVIAMLKGAAAKSKAA